MLETVLFDVGNTLLHLDYAWLAELAGRLGAPVSAEDVGRADARVRRQLNEKPEILHDSLAAYFAETGRDIGLPPAAAQAFGAQAEAEHQRDPRGIWRSVVEGAHETVGRLRGRGIRVGVVSNADGRVEAQLRLAGLRDLFAVVVDSHLAGVEKPDPRIFAIALSELGAEAQTALYVGDLVAVDVEGARAAGMHGLLFDPWDAYPELREERIRRLAELLGRI